MPLDLLVQPERQVTLEKLVSRGQPARPVTLGFWAEVENLAKVALVEDLDQRVKIKKNYYVLWLCILFLDLFY